ncbi:hypothetical protein JCM8097_003604 [Rhodosporidiobolus ruineniae]
MPQKRTSTTLASPSHQLRPRTRKRQKTASGQRRLAKQLDSDGDDQHAADDTESDYEDHVEQSRSRHGSTSSGVTTRRRSSAPTAARSGSTRRSSLPGARQSLGGAVAGPSRLREGGARNRRGGKEDDAVTQHPAQPRPRRRKDVLSPLPTNYAVHRSGTRDKGKGKERAHDDDDEPVRGQKRPRAPSAPVRVTRRTSGGLLDGHSSSSASRRAIRSGSRASEAGDEADEETIEEQDEDADQEMETAAERTEEEEDEDDEEEEEPPRRQHRGRRASQASFSDAGETADGEGGGDDREDESTPEQEDEPSRADSAKLELWPPSQLRQLKTAQLTNLYRMRYPDSAAPSTKDSLIDAILTARDRAPDSESSLTSISEGETDGDLSPHPLTSREASPEGADRRRAGGKAVRKKVVVGRKSGVRDQVPTPPHTSDEGDNDGGDDDEGEATETEPSRADEEELEEEPTPRLTRRLSEIEMPPPAIPMKRGHARTRSGALNVLPPIEGSPAGPALRKKAPSPKLRNRLLALADEPTVFTSPIAHRTRGAHPHSGGSSTALAPAAGTSASTTFSNPFNTSPRQRAAKLRATARLAKDGKGKGRADESSEEDEEMDVASDEYDDEDGEGDKTITAITLSSGSSDSDSDAHFDGDSSIEFIEPPPPARKKPAAPGAAGRRRSARTAKQLETPPSDADEESGNDGEQEEDETPERSPAPDEEDDSDVEIVEEETNSHLRRGGARGGHVKVVRLKNGGRAVHDDEEEDEDEVMELDDEDDEDAKATAGINLADATEKSLFRYKKDELLRLCEEHDVQHDNGANPTKKALVEALLQWRDKASDISSPASGESSSSSTVSNLSTQTAREETKTQALQAAEHASTRTSNGRTPLLMRPGHSMSPEKPHTAEHSKEHEKQEDVNALDLESLQLQDKEIMPDKLTKLERIGSGGFKDVYKGLYRKRTIAISDIRGHLTEMDIKELGLLRDLRHDNIVHFIGVSIPKQPSIVPVMIITELCANGDLFDYIRKTTPPPFVSMLEIMLGLSHGIQYLHTRKPTIIHRDIKSSNVLITSQGVAKIADFGLARIKTSTKSMIRSLVGTVNWQAPELWHPHPRYNEKVDVYSAGLVFWEVLQWHQPVKRYPFEGQNEHAIYHDVGARQLRPATGPLRRQWGGEVVDLVTAMWAQDASDRPSMTQVVAELELMISAEKTKSKKR